MTAPERIWARAHEGVRDSGFWIGHDGHHLPTLEYTRTDLVDAMIAEAAAKERERCIAAVQSLIDERVNATGESEVSTTCIGTLWNAQVAIRAGKGE